MTQEEANEILQRAFPSWVTWRVYPPDWRGWVTVEWSYVPPFLGAAPGSANNVVRRKETFVSSGINTRYAVEMALKTFQTKMDEAQSVYMKASDAARKEFMRL